MSNRVLILRPQPGADESAARAAALGLEPIVAPLFDIRPLPWIPPPADDFDAVMLTSANAGRSGGEGLAHYFALPCYAVGEATAAAARDAGFTNVRIGPDDGLALLFAMQAGGVSRVLHLCGVDHVTVDPAEIRIVPIPVYEAVTTKQLPAAALEHEAVALLHSPRAARRFASLVEDRARFAIAAISARTARAAGDGWRQIDIAPRPRDAALLELAAKLCQTGPQDR